jgi:hypothetical protein
MSNCAAPSALSPCVLYGVSESCTVVTGCYLVVWWGFGGCLLVLTQLKLPVSAC